MYIYIYIYIICLGASDVEPATFSVRVRHAEATWVSIGAACFIQTVVKPMIWR